MIYLEVVLWWLIVPALTVCCGCGIWRICANGWQAWKLRRLSADEAGAGVVPQASSDTGPGIYDREGDAAGAS